MVAESGDPIGFDARQWLNRWLREPVPALGGRLPVEFLHTLDGVARIMILTPTSLQAALVCGTRDSERI
ncbi:MbcA/ParS/Xre antitoxin family protein [Paraburkholderia megapolitana]|uniref:MbcA/ParS/Xre antitoxin family protein n=1 Tax=Paraburkholderia megapolitana TaxID=420953 RepID=UPI0038B79879